jgi:uncharacterized membrane protein YjjB (DUF3815 family)
MIRLAMAFLATTSYAVIYNVPRRALIPAGFVGAIAWLVLVVSQKLFNFNVVAASFSAALAVAVSSELLARIQRIPATVYSFAGIVTLVPGTSAFATMRAFIEGDYFTGLSRGTETMLIAGAVASGLVLAGAFMRWGRRGRYALKSQMHD